MQIYRFDREEVIERKVRVIQEAIRNRTGLKLSPGICPYDSEAYLRIGFMRDSYYDCGEEIPVLVISQSANCVFDLFYDLIRFVFGQEGPDADDISMVLESSHEDHCGEKHTDFYVEETDLYVFLSVLCEFEDIMANDGCCGVAVVSDRPRVEIQLDEHKLVVFYDGGRQKKYIHKLVPHLKKMGIPELDSLETVRGGDHVHWSTDDFKLKFEHLVSLTGAKP